MRSEATPVIVSILGKEYRIACPPEEQASLEASARYLDKKMREVRDQSRSMASDNVAVMAALNIAHELLQQNNTDNAEIGKSITNRVKNLHSKIEAALSSARQIEI